MKLSRVTKVNPRIDALTLLARLVAKGLCERDMVLHNESLFKKDGV